MLAENYARVNSFTSTEARETTGAAEESKACFLEYNYSSQVRLLLPTVMLLAEYLNLQLIFGASQASPPGMAEILIVSSKSPRSGTSTGKKV